MESKLAQAASPSLTLPIKTSRDGASENYWKAFATDLEFKLS